MVLNDSSQCKSVAMSLDCLSRILEGHLLLLQPIPSHMELSVFFQPWFLRIFQLCPCVLHLEFPMCKSALKTFSFFKLITYFSNLDLECRARTPRIKSCMLFWLSPPGVPTHTFFFMYVWYLTLSWILQYHHLPPPLTTSHSPTPCHPTK